MPPSPDFKGTLNYSNHKILWPKAEEVAEKILRHSKALGGISRITFQLDTAELPHEKLMETIHRIGSEVSPIVKAN